MLATIKKSLITSLHQCFNVNIAGGENMEVQGTIVEHEFEIYEGRRSEVDTYGWTSYPEADDF